MSFFSVKKSFQKSKDMLRLGILFFLFLKTSVSQNGNEVCTLLSICNNLDLLKSEMAAVREEQKRQTDILERLDKRHDSCTPNSYPASCAESSKNKLEIRVPEYSEDPFEVSCDQESHGGGWTLVMRRNDGSQDFFLEWKNYKLGFGDLDNEFFMGLDKLHAMTSEPQEMLVLLENWNGNQLYELYNDFRVGPEGNNYTLESVGKCSGTAGDSLTYHQDMQFSTKDRDNDIWDGNCAMEYTGAWWFSMCHWSNLCGTYGRDMGSRGVRWISANSVMKRAAMMIRPKAYFLKHRK